MRPKLTSWIILMGSALTACDKGSDSSSTASPTEPTPAVSTLPTTQALMTGVRTDLPLKFAPLSLKVPAGWEVKPSDDAKVVILQGPTPTAIVSISIPPNRFITPKQEKFLENDAENNRGKYAAGAKWAAVKDIPGAKVIDQFVISDPIPAGEGNAEPLQTVQWIFTVCTPADQGFTAYDLRFIGFTLKQYRSDEVFLRSIMESLTYTPTPSPAAQ